MQRNILFLLMLGFAGTVWGDDFSEFRIPRNRAVQTGFRFGANFSRQADRSTDSDWSKSSGYSHNGNGSFYHNLWTESDRSANELLFSGYLNESVSRSDANYRGYYIGENGNEHAQGYSFGSSAALSLEHDEYFVSELIGATIDMSGDISYSSSGSERHGYSRRWYSNDYQYRETLYSSESENWRQHYSFSIDVGPKFGRTRNVTAVASALVIEQRLIDSGVLSGKLQSSTQSALACVIYSSNFYYLKHDRSDKFFWADVEKVVASDPAYVKPLDAYTLSHIQEGYLGSTTRFRGLSFSPLFSYYHYNESRHSWNRQVQSYWDENGYQSEAYEGYGRNTTRRDHFLYGATVKYDVPFGLNWQYHLILRYFHDPRANYTGSPHAQIWQTGLESNLTWFMTDRWLGRADINIDMQFDDMVGDDSPMRERNESRIMLEVDYLALDKVSIFGQFSDRISYTVARNSHYDYDNGNTVTFYYEDVARWSEFRIGMTYSFRGPVLPNSNNYYYYSN